MIVSFGKILTFMIFIQLGFILLNYANIFPPGFAPEFRWLSDAYNDTVNSINALKGASTMEIVLNPGAAIWPFVASLKLAIVLILTAPLVAGETINVILGGIGGPPILNVFTIVFYLSFIVWVIRIVRGGGFE